MATRPSQNLQVAFKKKFQASGTVTEGFGVKLSADTTVVNCGAGELGIGIALNSGSSGDSITVVMGNGIATVKVGTGGATRGQFAVMAADGLTNQTLGGGTVVKHVFGQFTETGVVGDEVGFMVNVFDGVGA